MAPFGFHTESPSLLCIEECSLSFVLQIHPPLEKVFHLIPENAVMSGDDFVPGVLEPQADGNSTFTQCSKLQFKDVEILFLSACTQHLEFESCFEIFSINIVHLPGSGFVDILKKPRLAKTTPSFINKVSNCIHVYKF